MMLLVLQQSRLSGKLAFVCDSSSSSIIILSSFRRSSTVFLCPFCDRIKRFPFACNRTSNCCLMINILAACCLVGSKLNHKLHDDSTNISEWYTGEVTCISEQTISIKYEGYSDTFEWDKKEILEDIQNNDLLFLIH